MFRLTFKITTGILPVTFLTLLGCQSSGLRGHGTSVAHIYDASTFYETTSFMGDSFSPDESKLLVTSDQTGIFNLYELEISSQNLTALSHSKSDYNIGISYFPKDSRVLFTADNGGNEQNHLWVREIDGRVQDLTPGPAVRATFIGWSTDKNRFWILTNERDAKAFDVYEYSTADYSRKRIYSNTENREVNAISGDGHWLSLKQIHNNRDEDLYLVDLTKASAASKITPHRGDGTYRVFGFTAESKSLIYGSDQGREFYAAFAYDLKAAKSRLFYETKWDVSFVVYSKKGRYQAIGVNQDAVTAVQIKDLHSGQEVMVSGLPNGEIQGVSFSESEERLAFYVNGDRSPWNLYFVNLANLSPAQRLTQALKTVHAEDLVEGEVIRYKSFDGLEIPAILYRPIGASHEAPVPAVVWVHGGPGDQSRKGYSPVFQLLINHGYAVLAVNNRGSNGYGKTFYHMDDRRHGDVDLKDCIWGRRYLERLDWVDGKKVGIVGGSYGGFMVAAALTSEPEAFDVGIDIFGVTNWLRTLSSMPAWWGSMREALFDEMGDPKTDSERLRQISPLFHAQNIKRPMMVVQGANDPRVLKVESDEIVAAARKNGVPVEYLVFSDEGHGFLKRQNRIRASEGYLNFLNKYLR